MDPFEDDAPDNTPDVADDTPTAGDIMGVVALVDGIATAWSAVRDAGLPDDARGALQGVLLRAIAALAPVPDATPEAPPNSPTRTAEDARYRPIPGDLQRAPWRTGAVERVDREGARVRVSIPAEGGFVELEWWPLPAWSRSMWSNAVWIPAGVE